MQQKSDSVFLLTLVDLLLQIIFLAIFAGAVYIASEVKDDAAGVFSAGMEDEWMRFSLEARWQGLSDHLAETGEEVDGRLPTGG